MRRLFLFTQRFIKNLRIPMLSVLLMIGTVTFAQPVMEHLDRGLVAIKTGSGVFLSWRLLGNEEYDTEFNVYRNGQKITSTSIADRTNYVDASGSLSSTYYVKAVYDGIEDEESKTVIVWDSQIKRIPLDIPQGGVTPDEVAYTYSPNDCSVGDVDGDGEYEIIVKWDPSNAKDNAQSGYSGNVYIDAIKLNGTKLWRIDLGINIRAGAHYTQFMVYDLDLDGKAEVVCRTAPGTRDASGNYLKLGPAALQSIHSYDFRNSSGYILTGSEYLTVFNGLTGAEVSTINFQPARGDVSSWGDSYGNRVDRFLAGIAYLDGIHPSVIMSRGYYDKTGIAAYDFNGTAITQKWIFWADNLTGSNPSYEGQGNHQLAIADADGDGYDEILFGSMAIDHNGSPLYNTTLGHGDAYHVSDLDPDRAGLELFTVHEDAGKPYGISFRDAGTGEVIWGFDAGFDVGRGVSADIDPNHKGYECWAVGFSLYDCKGNWLSDNLPQSTSGSTSINHVVWWDGDLLSEILDRGVLNKYDYNTGGTSRLWTLYNEGASTNNGTKDNPALTVDLYGDWREEIIMRYYENDELLIFNTTVETSHKLYTLMSDPVYRCAIAWQNVAYNQPPHAGYYLGHGMATPTKPNITINPVDFYTYYSVDISIEGYGSVSPSSGNYEGGKELTLVATPDSGWLFDYWSGDTTSTSNEITINLNKDFEITAHFKTENAYSWNIYEAEDGAWSEGTVDTDHAGYTGTGYVNTTDAFGQWLDIDVYAEFNSSYIIKIVYANGTTTDRRAVMKVNGTVQIMSLSMEGSGNWNQWNDVDTIVNLTRGMNTIRLMPLTTGGLADIDRIELIINSAEGTNDIDSDNLINCYPLYVDNEFYVQMPFKRGNAVISLINMNGSTCLTKTLANQSQNQITTIDASTLSSGLYIVKIQIEQEVIMKRIIKK